METIFDLQHVSYTYLEKFEALNNVNLTMAAGEQIVIVGANGSGKSTLLSILAALIFPTVGEFYAFGSAVTEQAFNSLDGNEFGRFFRKKVGFLFQNPDIQLFCSTVFDEIAFGPLQLGMPQDEVKRRTEEIMSLMGIPGLKDRTPHTLSGGEKKKVCIASILSVNPDVLLLDEPTAGLDPRSQLWLIDLLQDLAKAGKTVITATHDLDIIEQISTRAVVFGEDHTIKADCDCRALTNNVDLLLSTNLIHEHMHRHATLMHEHLHGRYDEEHKHEH